VPDGRHGSTAPTPHARRDTGDDDPSRPDDARLQLTLEARSAGELLPLLYRELKELARRRLANEPPGQTLQATALVHEVYLRLVGERDPGWDGRSHFFGAAAEAMRRILVERARAKARLKRGGGCKRLELGDVALVSDEPGEDIHALDEALTRLEAHSARKARLVELLHFAGLTLEEAASVLGISPSTAKSDWRFARAWLHRELSR
jgi:RNA polymerase sigma factor (TIGR02999 family)